MTPLDNAKRLEWEADVAVAEAQEAVLAATNGEEKDRAIERLRLAMEQRLVRLAQRHVAERQARSADVKRAS